MSRVRDGLGADAGGEGVIAVVVLRLEYSSSVRSWYFLSGVRPGSVTM